MKYYSVQKGYDISDYISIDETELAMAIRAQITGKVALFKKGTAAGNHIISILPDWNKAEKVYNPTGPDLLPSKVRDEHLAFLRFTEESVQRELQGKPALPAPEPEALPSKN